MKLPFHLHVWVHNCNVTRFAVRTCVKCSRQESLLFDWRKQKPVWIEGVYHPMQPVVGVLAPDTEAFLKCRQKLSRDLEGVELKYVHANNIRELHYDGFFFLEGWHTNPDYESGELVRLINTTLDRS